MADPQVINIFTPHSSAGYYATNNQFQHSGPKGFMEFKILVNDDLYVRVDLPGVVKETVRYWTDQNKKLMFFEGKAPQESEHDEGGRSYLGASGLICDCCEISNVKADVRDGVVRMVLSKVKINKDKKSSKKRPCPGAHKSSDGSGQVLEDHPFLIKGPKGAFEAKPTKDGGLYVRMDLPGVAMKDAHAWVQGGEIRFFGRANRVMAHDVDGRDYLGSVSLCSSTTKIGRIQYEMKNGVLRMVIPSV